MPRASAAAYDLFGNGKTALKIEFQQVLPAVRRGSVHGVRRRGPADGKPQLVGLRHQPGTQRMFHGSSLATNGDGIAQDNEIGPGTATFGAARGPERQQHLKRQYNWEFTCGVQHQVAPRLAVGAMLYKRQIRNIAISDRAQIAPTDYTSFTLPMPDFSNDPTLSGVLNPNETMTVYNLNRTKTRRLQRADRGHQRNERQIALHGI